MSKLTESARWAPHCMSCGLDNPDGNLLCLAHSNRLQDGKGMGLKSKDHFHAAMCHACHTELPNMSREDREHAWQRAFEKTLTEYWQRGWLKVA